MKKHFIVFLLLCILAVGVVHTNAQAANRLTYNDMVGFLNAVDILDEMNEEKENSEISRIEFAVMAAKMLGVKESEPPEIDYFNDIQSDHWGKFSVNTLVERSIISGDGQRNFRPNDTITLQEASVILLRIMNKDHEAEKSGGYPGGYINIATKYKVISASVSADKLTYKDAVILIYNALNAELDPEKEGENLLSIYHKIYYGEGQLSAVCGASVIEDSISKMNQISIDGEVFEATTQWPYDRLGVFVKYYYIRNRYGDKTIVYISEDNDVKNKVVEITSDIYIGYNNGKVEYYSNPEKIKKKSEDVYSGVTVVRNGQNMSGNMDLAFADFYGKMKLIQTKGHSNFDVIIIEDYENIVAGTIDSKKRIIYDKERADVSVQLLEEDYDIITYVDMEGKESSFEKISVGDVISVAKSADGTFAKVVVSSNEVSGNVESTRLWEDSMIIVIDGNEYEFESRYYATNSPTITLGEKITIQTDLFGKIAGCSISKPESFKFAYLVNVFEDDAKERLLVKMYTEDSEMLVVVCAEKVVIDSDSCSTNNAIKKALSVKNEVKSQLIRFKCNMKNEIVAIDTAEDKNAPENSLHLMDNDKYLYKHWTNLVGRNAYVPTSVKVMIVPEEGTEKEASAEQFQVKNISAVPSGKGRRLDLYQIDKNSLTIDFVVYYNAIKSSVDTYASLQVVEKTMKGLNSDNETVCIFRLDSTGNGVNYAISSNYNKDNIDPELINKGDVIRIATDYKNEITSIQRVLDYERARADENQYGNDQFFTNSLYDSFKGVENTKEDNFFDGFKMSYGYVARTSGNLIQWGYEKPGDADELYNVSFDSNKAKVLIYDEEDLEDPCKLGTVNDIIGYYTSNEDCSKLIAVSKSAIITNMVVFK